MNECSEQDRAGLCWVRKALSLEIRKVNVMVGGDLVPFKIGRILHKTTDVQVSPGIASCPPFEEKGPQLTL